MVAQKSKTLSGKSKSSGGREISKKSNVKKSSGTVSTGNPEFLDTNPAETSGSVGAISVGGYVLTFAFTGNYTLTIPKSGSAVVGTGSVNKIPYFTDANTVAASNLEMSGSNVLTLAADATATFTVPYTGKAQTAKSSALSPSAAIAMAWGNGSLFTLTPDQSATITPSGGFVGQVVQLVITTSGSSSYTMTFDSNVKSQGTLATGTVTAKTFVLQFVKISDTVYAEISRTTAM